MENLFLVKIGGALLDDEASLAAFLRDFAAIAGKKILIHGGGKLATDLAQTLGIETQMVNGRRITDKETLKIVTMVYAGFINKTMVSGLQAHGCNALGLTGADANLILAHKRRDEKIDYGFVGDIDHVNAAALGQMLDAGFTPVFAPLTHDGAGNMLNTNADTIAATLARALQKHYHTRLVFGFDKKGVLASNDDNDVIPKLPEAEYHRLRELGVISKGMLPKLDSAFKALRAGVQRVLICHASQLAEALRGEACGTELIP
jgi:acetylglutamate kinase